VKGLAQGPGEAAAGGPTDAILRDGRKWVTRGAAETERLGAALAPELVPDGVLLLSGELGSGKTVLVRGLAGALGIDPRQVLSPTFNLIREHQGGGGGGGRLAHLDLYRLEPEEAAGLGLDELLSGGGVKAVEWAERLPCPASGALGALGRKGAPILALRLRRLPEVGEDAREVVEVLTPEEEAPRTDGGGSLQTAINHENYGGRSEYEDS
jgi:tRNA threonylcarbamoyladenosine biosynthesis protein TsaE